MDRVVWKGTNHAVFDLIRASRAGAEPGSLHSLVSLIFAHFERDLKREINGERPRESKKTQKGNEGEDMSS